MHVLVQDIPDDKLAEALMTKECNPLHLVVVRRDDKITGLFLTGDTDTVVSRVSGKDRNCRTRYS